MSIRTGYMTSTHTGMAAAGDPIARSEFAVLFSPESPVDTLFSPQFVVTPGAAVLLCAYEMEPDGLLTVNRIVVGAYSSKQVTESVFAERAGIQAGHILYERKVLSRRGMWSLSAAYPELIIVVPGVYRLECSSLAILGKDMYVEYRQWNMTTTPRIPETYIAG